MKVCDVVCNSIWFDPRVRKQIIEYKKNGVDVCAVGLKCERYDEEKVSQIPCRVGIATIDERFDGKQRGVLRKLWRSHLRSKAMQKILLAENPDIIHANDLDALLAVYPAYKKLKCKLVYDSHEIYAENNIVINKRFYAAYLRIMENYICKRIDKMVCVSHAAADYFAKLYKIEKPMVITNCSLKAEQAVASEKNEGFEVLNHGRFSDGRGYDVVVESAPLLRDYPEIKVALRGFGRLEESLKARAKELGDENIRFYPKVLVQELIPQASRAHVGVAITEAICLNFELSVSNKIFEYASAGLPVIMSDIPEHRYLNGKYNFGIVLEDNRPETFATAVIKMYTDKEFYNKCAENAKKLSNEVNWETEFKRLIDFEREAVAAK